MSKLVGGSLMSTRDLHDLYTKSYFKNNCDNKQACTYIQYIEEMLMFQIEGGVDPTFTAEIDREYASMFINKRMEIFLTDKYEIYQEIEKILRYYFTEVCGLFFKSTPTGRANCAIEISVSLKQFD